MTIRQQREEGASGCPDAALILPHMTVVTGAIMVMREGGVGGWIDSRGDLRRSLRHLHDWERHGRQHQSQK